ncbi:hypothetical protein V2J09_001552 [Rumex salicifolius]
MTSSVLFALLFYYFVCSNSEATVGINYGRIADNLPSPNDVVKLIQSYGLTRAKIYDADPTVLSAFSNSGISLVISLPNNLLCSAASNQSFTDTWIQSTLLPFHPATNVTAIAVGNEVFSGDPSSTAFLFRVALSCLGTLFPPSVGKFKDELVGHAVKPLLEFLRRKNSFLMVNVYPFFAYSANAGDISLDYALLRPGNSGVVDSGNGLHYSSLFDAQVDAVYSAMQALQYDDVAVVVTETGWPSAGDAVEAGAGPTNAASYNGNLVRRVLTGTDRPNRVLDVYLFALFNEDRKPGPTSERNYGLFYPDETRVYYLPLTAADVVANRSSPAPAPTEGVTWCVANGKAGAEKLQQGLDYACGEGGADCRPIQPGATCYDPDTLEAHASYAFNSYYQLKARGSGTCYFGGAAYVVFQAPSYGSCKFPSRYAQRK